LFGRLFDHAVDHMEDEGFSEEQEDKLDELEKEIRDA
jgi:hypothetical protein